MATRQEVYEAIDSERAYQDKRWTSANTKGSPDRVRRHSIEEWLVYIDNYLLDAKQVLSREEYPECDYKALHTIRKVAAMCVACLEDHGAPHREGL